MVFMARNFNDAELLQVLVDELGIQQLEPLPPQPCREINQRNFAGIGGGREHALAKKSATDSDAVDPADEFPLLPGFDAMRVTLFMQRGIERDDLVVDPCLRPC